MAGVLAAFSRGEVEAKSQRQIDANADRRKEGQFYRGMTPTGYVRGDVKVVTADDGSFTVHPMSQEIGETYEVLKHSIVPDPKVGETVRQGFRMVLEGKPLRDIANHWDEQGFKPPRAEKWSLTSVNKLLVSPTFAAIQTHNGVELGDGKWIGYLTRTEHYEVLKSLASRRKSHGVRQPKQDYLLTGILVCSCGRYMTGTTGYKGLRYYRCSGRSSASCARSVELEQAHSRILGHVMGSLVTMNPQELVSEETRIKQQELARQLVRISADRRAVKNNGKLSVMSKAELYQELDQEEQETLEAVRKLDAENSLTQLLSFVLPWLEDGRVTFGAYSRSAESVRMRFNELGMIQQRVVVDALGLYKLSEGKRGRWTTVEIYPKDPITGEISDFSTDEDPHQD